MKLDAHVHTMFSGKMNIRPVHTVLNESYSAPEAVYRRAKSRGMDLVAITDHDSIEGALWLADREDVIMGCEVTGVFASDGITVHLGVLGISEEQHREIQKLRHDIRELMPYLREQEIFTTLNHVASKVSGHITASHIAALVPWVDAIEALNGARLPGQNRTAAALAQAYGKVAMAGSDSHTLSRIGATYVSAEARNRTEFMAALRSGKVQLNGAQGSYFTLASDIIRLSACFYREGLVELGRSPLDWKKHAMVCASILSVPLVFAALAGALVHVVDEGRFNRALMGDLVSGQGDCLERFTL